MPEVVVSKIITITLSEEEALALKAQLGSCERYDVLDALYQCLRDVS